MADEPQLPSVRIETPALTVELCGPEATVDAAFGLWDNLWARLSNSKLPGAYAGGMGFSAELDPDR